MVIQTLVVSKTIISYFFSQKYRWQLINFIPKMKINNLQQPKYSMSEFPNFFIKIDGHDDLQYPISIKILHSQTFIQEDTSVSLCQKNVIFKRNETDGPSMINKSSKMVPKYLSNQKGQHYLDQLTIHLGNCYLTFSSQKKEQLNKIYNKLKLLISHKGFNDYFKPIKRLGKGAFATVYLIQHKISKQRFAAKVFCKQGQKLQFKGQQALQNQIKTLRFLSHPNIIKYQGVYETDNLIYLVTEYLSGGTLEEFMRNRANLTGEVVLSILKETLLTLQYLQINNILHRDLKPENILLRESDSKWVLADFGLSAFTTQNNIYDKCGTLGYMAPQFFCENLEERKINQSYNVCDMYSLGIIAYQTIFGNLPFRVETQSMFDRKIVWDAWKRSQCEQIHPQILIFLKGLLQSNPMKRWTWKKAYQSSFLNNSTVKQAWNSYSKLKIEQRYQKILKMANIN